MFESLSTSVLKVFVFILITFPAMSDWSPRVYLIILCSWIKFSWFLLQSLLFCMSQYLPVGLCSLQRPNFHFLNFVVMDFFFFFLLSFSCCLLCCFVLFCLLPSSYILFIIISVACFRNVLREALPLFLVFFVWVHWWKFLIFLQLDVVLLSK